MSPHQIALLLTLAGGASFALSAGLTWIARRVAPRLGYVDHPGGHKSHATATPYGGGVAIFLAAWLPMALALAAVTIAPADWLASRVGAELGVYLRGLGTRGGAGWLILAAGLLLHVVGLIDDRRPLSAPVKLVLIALLAAAVAGWGQVRIAEFAGPGVSLVLTVLWIVVVTNAFNFLDNMDGLSAGVAGICTAALVACGLLAGQVLVPVAGCVLLGALLGFLLFNFPPATIFMGDAGSLFTGYMLAVISVLTTYYESAAGAAPYALAMPLVILAVPLYDFSSVVFIRLAERRNPLLGDQRHFSHRLVERGLSRRGAVLTIYLASATTAASATLLPGADLRTTVTVAAIVLMILAIIAILEAPPRAAR